MNLHRVIGALGDFEEDEVRALLDASVRELDYRAAEKVKEGEHVHFRTHGDQRACLWIFPSGRKTQKDLDEEPRVWFPGLVTCLGCKGSRAYRNAWVDEV